MNASTYWQKLRSIGWLDYLTDEEQTSLRAQLEHNLAQKNAWDAHMALAQTAFEDDPPDEMLLTLGKISRGLFVPTDISVEGDDESMTLAFKHAGRTFSTDLLRTQVLSFLTVWLLSPMRHSISMFRNAFLFYPTHRISIAWCLFRRKFICERRKRKS